jgi:hypothetical protein
MPTLCLVYFFSPCYTSTQHEAQKEAAVSGIMRIAVLSDTHLQRIGREFKLIYDHYLRDVDVILHAGDFTASDVIAFLSKKPFHGVQGNMDSLEVKVSLPEKKVIEICGYRIGLVHGWGPSISRRIIGKREFSSSIRVQPQDFHQKGSIPLGLLNAVTSSVVRSSTLTDRLLKNAHLPA